MHLFSIINGLVLHLPCTNFHEGSWRITGEKQEKNSLQMY